MSTVSEEVLIQDSLYERVATLVIERVIQVGPLSGLLFFKEQTTLLGQERVAHIWLYISLYLFNNYPSYYHIINRLAYYDEASIRRNEERVISITRLLRAEGYL